MINQVRQTVMSMLNKANFGYVTPSDFNLYAAQAQLDIFKQYMYDIRYNVHKINNRVTSEGLGDTTELQREALRKFQVSNTLTQDSGNVYFLPSDITTGDTHYKILDINVYDTGVFQGKAEVSDKWYVTQLINSMLTTPTKTFPVCYTEGEKVYVYPATITGASDVECVYIRYPKEPKWTYITLSAGEPVFDASQPDYQDFEIPEHEFNELVIRILQYAGMSIREVQAVQFADNTENQEEMQER